MSSIIKISIFKKKKTFKKKFSIQYFWLSQIIYLIFSSDT